MKQNDACFFPLLSEEQEMQTISPAALQLCHLHTDISLDPQTGCGTSDGGRFTDISSVETVENTETENGRVSRPKA